MTKLWVLAANSGKFLGRLREQLSAPLGALVSLELDKDCTAL